MKTLLALFSTVAAVAAIPAGAAPTAMVPLHAAPFEVAPVIAELPAENPLLVEAVPVLEAAPPEGPRGQAPWHWVVLDGEFRGYISTEDWMDGEPRSGARIHSAPDFESPVLRHGRGLPATMRAVGEVGPFTHVVFHAELALFFDPVATPEVKEFIEDYGFMEPAEALPDPVSETPPAVEPDVEQEVLHRPVEAENPRARRFPVAERHGVRWDSVVQEPRAPREPTVDEPRAPHEPVVAEPRAPREPVAAAPRSGRTSPSVDGSAPGAPLRIIQGQIVTASSLGIRRSPFRWVLVSASGSPIAFVDVSNLLTNHPSELLERRVSAYGELRPYDHRRIRTVLVARSIRAL